MHCITVPVNFHTSSGLRNSKVELSRSLRMEQTLTNSRAYFDKHIPISRPSCRLSLISHLIENAKKKNCMYIGLGRGLSLGSSLVATQIPNGSSRTVLDHHMNASNFLGENSQSFDSIAFERSFSSHSLDTRPSFLVQPNFSSSMFDSPKLRIVAQNQSEHGGLGGPMRRACSTGDLQKFNKMQLAYRSPNQHSHEMMNPSCIEETSSLRVGRYSPEERKQRIHRYIRKRTQRNFNKTIKYACRKTLADSRPRVRGRFARNDEICDIPKAANHAADEDEDLWFDEIHDIVGLSSDGWNLDF